MRALIADAVEDQLALNRALPRTLAGLLFQPGFLTQEYVRGRIVRYIAPFRLYLVTSVLFFLLLSFIGLQGLDVGVTQTGAAADSAVSELQARLQVLEATDTSALPASARAVLRAQIAEASTALQVLTDAGLRQDTAAAQDTMAAPGPLAPGTLQPWARQITFEGASPLFRSALQRKLAQVGHLPPGDALREVLRDLLEYAPHMVFLLLPLFALMLKLLYIRRSRYYAEHFVFALHVHAFMFVMFTVMFILPWDGVNIIIVIWIAVYVWLALRRVYRQGWLRTTLKWWILGWMYFGALLLGVVGLAVVTLLFT